MSTYQPWISINILKIHSRFLLGTWQAKKRDEHLKEKPPPIGSVHLDEQLLRKLFQKMDRMPCRNLLNSGRISQQFPNLPWHANICLIGFLQLFIFHQDLDNCEAWGCRMGHATGGPLKFLKHQHVQCIWTGHQQQSSATSFPAEAWNVPLKWL